MRQHHNSKKKLQALHTASFAKQLHSLENLTAEIRPQWWYCYWTSNYQGHASMQPPFDTCVQLLPTTKMIIYRSAPSWFSLSDTTMRRPMDTNWLTFWPPDPAFSTNYQKNWETHNPESKTFFVDNHSSHLKNHSDLNTIVQRGKPTKPSLDSLVKSNCTALLFGNYDDSLDDQISSSTTSLFDSKTLSSHQLIPGINFDFSRISSVYKRPTCPFDD